MRTVLGLLFLCVVPLAGADPAPKEGKPWVVLAQTPTPSSHQLDHLLGRIRPHRADKQFGWGPAELANWIHVDGEAIVDTDGRVLTTQLDLDALRRDVYGAFGVGRLRFLVAKVTLHFTMARPRAVIRLLELALVRLLQEIGYESDLIEVETVVDPGRWKRVVTLTQGRTGKIEDSEKEEGIGDDLVRIYPVRTIATRLFLESDCCIHLQKQFPDDSEGQLDAATRKALAGYVGKLQLPKKDRVAFIVSGSKAMVQLFREKTAKALATELGFADHAIRTVGLE